MVHWHVLILLIRLLRNWRKIQAHATAVQFYLLTTPVQQKCKSTLYCLSWRVILYKVTSRKLFQLCNVQAYLRNTTLYVGSRLYIDRLAHWRCSLVDPQLEIQALAAVPKVFLNYTSRESRNLSFNLVWMNKKLLCHDGIRTQDPRVMKPTSYHWATAYFQIMVWYFVYISYKTIA